MRTITKPALKVRNVFLECISTVDDAVLKQALTNCTDIIENAETEFEEKFLTHELYQIPQRLVIRGTIGKEEMKTVYNYRMVRDGMPGRKYYNQLLAAAPQGKCPLCSIRNADTLDHYLPKSKYPIYSVTPVNLIPACTLCNKGKLIDYPTSGENQTLHPYYDNIETQSWIKATILQTSPVSFNFYSMPPDTWPEILKDRVNNHFSSFKLNELFSSHANEELQSAREQLIKNYNNHPDQLVAHLQDAYQSKLVHGINSWRAVTYYTLLTDDWFCSGGVLV